MQNFNKNSAFKRNSESDLGYNPGPYLVSSGSDLNICPNCDSECLPKVFDSLSARMFEEPRSLFHLVHQHWKTCCKTLYAECERLGHDRVLATIMDISLSHKIKNKGAYLRTCLRRMH